MERMFAPRTAGRLIRKENFTAKSRRSPVAIPAVIVVPERERPGTTATHWHRPMISASNTVILRSVFLPGVILSDT